MKVLIIQQKMLGDVLATSILFKTLKEKFPNSSLHYLMNSGHSAMVENNPHVDRVIEIEKSVQNSTIELYKLAKKLSKNEYDVIIDAYSKLSSNLISYNTKAKTKISKYKWYTNFIYSHTIVESSESKTTAGLALENRMSLLEPLNISDVPIPKPKLYLSEEEISNAKTLLNKAEIDSSKPLFMIAILGSSSEKTYPFNYLTKLLEQIIDETDATLLFNYIPNQIDDVDKIYSNCSLAVQKKIKKDVYGKSLREFFALCAQCDALIGNEGGATNMAKALNVPTFTIFSPWIKKEAWNSFENGSTNVSVHLKDYREDLYNNISSYKSIKNKSDKLYELFKPELIQDKLSAFLAQFNGD